MKNISKVKSTKFNAFEKEEEKENDEALQEEAIEEEGDNQI